MRVGLDTNVLIYSADPRNAQKQALAHDVIRRTATGSGAVAEQCLFEFISVTTRRLNVPMALSIGLARKWPLILGVVVPPPNIFDLAVALIQAHKIAGWDARLLATYSAAGVTVMLSEDLQDGGRYGSITVINPFAPANEALVTRLLPP